MSYKKPDSPEVTQRSFVIPSRFHPPHSLLGRWIRSRISDPRKSESVFIISVVLGAVGLLLVQIFSWTFLQPLDAGMRLIFFGVQAAAASVFAGVCLIGREPKITIQLRGNELTATRKSAESLRIPFAEIESFSLLDARTFHRHYRRYAETITLVNHVPDELLLLRWGSRPVVVGLDEAECRVVKETLERAAVRRLASSRVSAA